MRKSLLFLLLILFSFPVFSQKVEWLNSHKYPIRDTAKYQPKYFRVTSENNDEKNIKTFSLDSIVIYQRTEVFDQKGQLISESVAWHFDSEQVEKEVYFLAKKDLRETKEYYKSGNVKSVVIEKKDRIVSEKYYSESGENIPKPIIVNSAPFGGLKGWQEYLSLNLIYPESARRMNFEGLVYLTFMIDDEGKMEDIEVMNPEDNHFLLNQEAFRVVKAYPYLWTPTTINGKPEKSQMRLPVRFKLTD